MKWFIRSLAILLVIGVIVFLFFRVPDTDRDEMWAKYGTEPSQAVELADGRTVHVRDEGPRDAPVVMLLHGSNADLITWQPWAEILREDFRVIRYDQRGHGLTGPAPDGNYSRASFVADVEAVADAMELDTFTLAGNSMGGWIAMAYALQHSDRLDALVLVDASGAPIEREGGGNLAFTLASMPVVGDGLSQLLPRALVAKSLSQSVSNQDVVTDAAIDRYWEMARYPGNRTATRQRFQTERQNFTEDQAATMSVPTLVMWGTEDALVPFEAGEWYAEHLPNSTLVAYEGIGHIPMEEAAERSAADFATWHSRVMSPQNSDGPEPQ